MSRMRYVKPSFFLNDKLADLKPLTRLLFVGLWCLADRKGRLEDRPRSIRAQLLPFDRCNCANMLQDLHDAGFILRYEESGTNYIQILKFEKHQSPHVKEVASTIPAPGLNGAKTPVTVTDTGTLTLTSTDTVRASARDSSSFFEERYKRKDHHADDPRRATSVGSG